MSGEPGAVPGILVIGIGNRDRGDDGAGLAVAAALRGRVAGVRVLEHEGEGIDLLGAWSGHRAVFLVDAVVSGARPGVIHRVDPVREPLAVRPRCLSSHWLGIDQVIHLARTLELLPETLVVFGIEAQRFEPGSPMDRRVAAAVPRTAARIAAEIRALRSGISSSRPASVPGR